MSREVLRVEGLTRHFGGFAAVTDLGFGVNEGEIVGLVGPNGAGKTTTFNLVTGFIKPTSGTVTLFGENVTGLAPHVLARRGMVRTFQHTRVFADLTVRENIGAASHLVERGGPLRTVFGSRVEHGALQRRIDEVLDLVGLTHLQHNTAGSLSYGDQRVLEIALALAPVPKLLLLDEPFAGMNDTESAATMELIHRIRAGGVTVLVIDHHMQTMARGCDRLVVMDHGVKLAEGVPATVVNKPEVVSAYLGAGDEVTAPVTVPQPDVVLRVQDLAVRYGRIAALRGVSLEVRRGEIVALVGANGAGKTTMLRAVSGLVPTAAGGIELLGKRVDGVDPVSRVHAGLAHCPEGREVFPRMTVLENLTLGAANLSGSDIGTELRHVYEIFPRLAERSHQLAGSLSGGEQQMLAIGRALMSRPKVLILDEPTLGLSPLLAREVGETLVRLNEEGLSVLLVEQNAVLALAISHRAYVLENGVMALSGPAGELRNDEAVKRVYLGA